VITSHHVSRSCRVGRQRDVFRWAHVLVLVLRSPWGPHAPVGVRVPVSVASVRYSCCGDAAALGEDGAANRSPFSITEQNETVMRDDGGPASHCCGSLPGAGPRPPPSGAHGSFCYRARSPCCALPALRVAAAAGVNGLLS